MLINDLSAHIRAHKNDIEHAFQRVIESGWLVLGPEVKRFEESFAHYIGVPYCIGVANGTDAIELALSAMDIGEGDRVATVANAGMYSSIAINAIGATPIFMDVDLNTFNVTLSEVELAINKGAKAVIITHLYGLAVREIGAIATLCRTKNVRLLEDCAQAHGAVISSLKVGSFGDAASYSFYPTKNLGALGDGGAVVTKSKLLAEKVLQLRQYGWTLKYQVEINGGRNSRLDELQAAFLLNFLPKLDSFNALRRNIAVRYTSLINNPLVITPKLIDASNVSHLYVLRSEDRNLLRLHLSSLGISSEIHYPIPDHRQNLFNHSFTQISLPNTEKLSTEILTLPCYPEMTDEQVELVIKGVNTWSM
jgi:dTDP-3-amino-2,3,6-trideoxy-4-keto-D-glucose/dTDP-3-amino-3,4,6-trideoxy-alpha-D-glucose/dTDP-2,6-dideoxy-D-kanosamine transaminase